MAYWSIMTGRTQYLLRLVESRLEGTGRYILGITGPPASGKSTLSRDLVRTINDREGAEIAVLLGMDGFHKSNADLKELGLLHLKGIPESFDSQKYVGLLSVLKKYPEETHHAPEFRREIEASIQNAIAIHPHHKLVVTEGNYLLLESYPWKELSQIIDEVWYLEIEEEIRLRRLTERHLFHGRSQEETAKKIDETDDPNTRLIEESKNRADRVLKIDA